MKWIIFKLFKKRIKKSNEENNLVELRMEKEGEREREKNRVEREGEREE